MKRVLARTMPSVGVEVVAVSIIAVYIVAVGIMLAFPQVAQLVVPLILA
jgi:hypothetical protein